MQNEYYNNLATSIAEVLVNKNLNVNEFGGELEQKLVRYQLVLTNEGIHEEDRKTVAAETLNLLEIAKVFPDNPMANRKRK